MNRGFIPAGTEFSVAVYLNGVTDLTGVTDLANYSVVVQYEPDQLTYIGFADGSATEPNFLGTAGGTVMSLSPILGANSVEFGKAILGASAAKAPDGTGLIGVLTFATNDNFTQSDLIITEYSLKSVGQNQATFATVLIGRVAIGEVDLNIPSGEVSQLAGGFSSEAADFSGDDRIDFSDFFVFVDFFGRDATGTAEKFDLDRSGRVDFGDFFIFLDLWVPASKMVASVWPEPVGGSLALGATDRGSDLLARPALASETELDRYGFFLRYDPDQLALPRRTLWTEEILAAEVAPGRVLVSSRPGDTAELSLLWKERVAGHLEQPAPIPLDIESAVARGSDGSLFQLLTRSPAPDAVPAVYQLAQNYPNPFNPTTAIRFDLPSAAEVHLEVYNILGQKVRTLVREMRSAGQYRVVWNGQNTAGQPLAAGVYVYRLEARHETGTFSKERKLLLLK